MDDPKHNQPPLADRLALDHEELAEAITAYLARARDTVPIEVTTDSENEIIATFVKDARALMKRCEEARKAEKQPFRDAAAAVDTFFEVMTERLMKGRDVIEARGDRFLKAKAEAERARREEAAKAAREEAERRDREARAAEEAGRVVAADIARSRSEEAAQRAEDLDAASRDSAADLARTRSAAGVSTLTTKPAFEIEDIEKIPLAKLRPYFSRPDIEKAIRAFVRAGGKDLKGVRFFETTRASYR